MTPAELKAKWIDALRSGKYRQGYGSLRRNRLYCCLGVLGKVGGVKSDRITGYSYLPTYFQKASGLSGEVVGQCMAMNDEARQTFPEIADWIETHDLQTGEPL